MLSQKLKINHINTTMWSVTLIILRDSHVHRWAQVPMFSRDSPFQLRSWKLREVIVRGSIIDKSRLFPSREQTTEKCNPTGGATLSEFLLQARGPVYIPCCLFSVRNSGPVLDLRRELIWAHDIAKRNIDWRACWWERSQALYVDLFVVRSLCSVGWNTRHSAYISSVLAFHRVEGTTG